MTYGLRTLRGLAGCARRAGAISAAAMFAVVALAACDPRGSANFETLYKRAQEQREAGNVRASIIELKNALQKEPQNAAGRLLLGQGFIDIGDSASAEIELRRARELGADATRATLLLGEAKMLQGRFDQVLRDFPVDEAAAAPAKAAMLELRGRAHFSLGQRVQSEEAFKAALEQDAKSADALVGLARVAFATGNAAAGRDFLSRAAAIAPENAKVLVLQGESAYSEKNFEAAENYYKQLLKTHKDDLVALNAHLGVSRAQIAGGKLKDATARLTQLAKMAPNDVNVNYLRALAAYQSKEYDVAKTHAEIALRRAPNHRPSLFIAGASNYALQQNETALRYLTSFVNAVPESIEGRKMLAALQLRMGEPAQASRTLQGAKTQDAQMLAMAGAAAAQAGDAVGAKGALEQAVAAEPENAEARARLGLTRIALGETEQGLKDLEDASKLEGASVQSDIALVFQYLRVRDFEKALASAKTVQEKQPSSAGGYTLEGIVHAASGQIPQAKAALDKALQIAPGNQLAVQQRVAIALSEQQIDLAKKLYGDLIKASPNNAPAMVQAAMLETRTGNMRAAEDLLQRAVNADPADVGPRVALARFYLAQNNPAKALVPALNAFRQQSNDAGILEVLGQAYLGTGQAEDAIRTFDSLVAAQPNSPAAYAYSAMAYERGDRRDRALQQIERAHGLAPNDPGIKLERARLLAANGKADEAGKVLADLRAGPALTPELDAGMTSLEGALALAASRSDDAVRLFRKAHEIQKSNVSLIRLTVAMAQSGRRDDAMKELGGWLSQNPNDLYVRTAVAQVYMANNQLEQARGEYAEIVRQAPDNVQALNNLAWVLTELGRPQEALPHARRASTIVPQNPAILDTLGVVLLRTGNTGEAVSVLRSAVSQLPLAAIEMNLAEALIKQGNAKEAREILQRIVRDSKSEADKGRAEKLLGTLG